MNPLPHVIGAAAEAADAVVLDTGTAVLILLTVAVAWLASSVMSLRNEVQDLKDLLRAGPGVSARSPAAAGTPTPVEIAAIAAAVHCVCGRTARLVAVVPDSAAQAWSREGRREVFQSHQLR